MSSNFLARKRRYALLITVVIAAAITPTPDMITCLMMTGPLYALYEISLIIVWLTERAAARRRAREEERDQGVLPVSNT
ncbi:twin-arginine translocase subunit TatC [Thermodesulfitimonas sp.]